MSTFDVAGRVATDERAVVTGLPDGFEVVCPLDRIRPESGVTALVGGEAVAVFRTHADDVYALSNFDPYGRASVLSRGIVGTRTRPVAGAAEGVTEQVPFVASPLLKQPFDLRTGVCLDDPTTAVPTYEVEVIDGTVAVGPRRATIGS